MTSKWAERARSSPYYPALSQPVFRKVLPGTAASALGDGMTAVAIAWLAIELAPPGSRGLWVVLAVSYARIAPLAARLAEPAGLPAPAAPPPAAATTTSAWATIRSSPVLPGLLALTFVFYLLDGPIEVALPVHVTTDLHGSAALLGTIWAIFGVGAVIGELSAPFLRRWPVWPVMTAIVLGWGLALVPFGLPTPLWIGIALGAPLVAALGARVTLLVSALATIALGLITVAVLLTHRRPHPSR